jgi:hypothetical protein
MFQMIHTMHIMYYLMAKEEMQMAFGAVDGVAGTAGGGVGRCGCGIAIIVVIILLLIALGIVF